MAKKPVKRPAKKKVAPTAKRGALRLVISSGHGRYVRGAVGPSPWGLDEVNEARKVVDRVAAILTQRRHNVEVFHDNVSTSQDQNLNRIVNFHNSKTRDLDVSVHFNAYQVTEGARGTEVWYVTQANLANEVSAAMAVAGGFIDRGGKYSSGLYFLNKTTEPSILLEVCFVDAHADCNLYHANFEEICQSIAGSLVGEEALPEPPPLGPDLEGLPTLGKGDEGPSVRYLQQELNSDNRAGLIVDGDFGSATDTAVRNYQASRRLTVDGIVGPNTWEALIHDRPAVTPPGLPPVMSTEEIRAVTQIAARSEIAAYSWRDRGRAPIGYIKGVAVAWANTVRVFRLGYAAMADMAKAKTGDSNKDALEWYDDIFRSEGMNNSVAGIDTLRHLWVLIMGLGMRESSGKHCEGRDQSAENTSSDTAEAGAWQTSYDARGGSNFFNVFFEVYNQGGGNNPQGFVEVFREGVSCSSSSWQNYGSGNGYRHQQMSKEQPAYAAAVCAITLRNLRKHYGPIERKEAEVVTEADEMLAEVQGFMEARPFGPERELQEAERSG